MKEKMLTVRLDKETEAELKKYAEDHDMSKSMIVKEALVNYMRSNKKSPYELGTDLFGVDGSGTSNLSSTYKAKLKEKLNEKHTH